MFQHFIVKNFRCFAGLHLKDLARVNLIAGMNNTGKTALLEAIHLHNNPSNVLLVNEINKVRGVQEPLKDFEDVCGWLFWNKHLACGPVMQSNDDKGIARTLSMFILDAATSTERFPEAEKAFTTGFMNFGSRLILKYEQPPEPDRISIATESMGPAMGTGSIWMNARIPWSMPSVYLNSGVAPPVQDLKFFGELDVAKRVEEIMPPLRIMEPRLQSLSLAPLAGETVIHGDIGLPRKVPTPFMGEGFRRVLSLVLAIANAPGGVVLIDEIENGLHYSVQKDVWKAVAEAARVADAQVFATTHSWECVLRAHEAFSEGDENDLRLYRLDRFKDEITAVRYDQEMIETALIAGLEMR
jgi:hypothetical protein